MRNSGSDKELQYEKNSRYINILPIMRNHRRVIGNSPGGRAV